MKRPARVLVLSVIITLLVLGGARTAQAEQNNALTDDQYAAFDLNLPDANGYIASTDPLSSYKPLVVSELYLGTMNAAGQPHYEGSFWVMNEATTLSADVLNINAMMKRAARNHD